MDETSSSFLSSIFGGSARGYADGGRSPHEITLPTSATKKPHQPTVVLTTPTQLNTTSTVPMAHNTQAI